MFTSPCSHGWLNPRRESHVAKLHDSVENLFPAAIRAKGIMTARRRARTGLATTIVCFVIAMGE